jgi:hypothetical protein
LLELPRHRDQPLADGGHVLPRRAATPRIRPRAAVREDAPREHEAFLSLGPKLRQRREVVFVEQPVGQVELCLHVCLVAGRPNEGRIAARPEQEPDRLRENRLTRARLAGDRVQAGGELEVRLANEHEVVDAQAPEHEAIVESARDADHPPIEPRLDPPRQERLERTNGCAARSPRDMALRFPIPNPHPPTGQEDGSPRLAARVCRLRANRSTRRRARGGRARGGGATQADGDLGRHGPYGPNVSL